VDSRRLRWWLGGLWLLDGLLQLQPGMFSMAMVQAVLQPATASNPRWVNAPVQWVIAVFTRHLLVANATVAAIQIIIGMGLLVAGGTDRWPYWLSLIWSLLLWPLGQAYGGLFSGQASLLTGAPGSAVLYGLLTWAAWPLRSGTAGRDPEEGRRRGLTAALGAVWAAGAALQTAQPFFTRAGLSGLITDNTPGQPVWMANLLQWGGTLLGLHPVAANELLIALMAACALTLWMLPSRILGFWLSGALALGAWVFGQAFGMLWTGMATDPNTAPLLVLLGAYVALPRRSPRAAAAPEAAVPAGEGVPRGDP